MRLIYTLSQCAQLRKALFLTPGVRFDAQVTIKMEGTRGNVRPAILNVLQNITSHKFNLHANQR